MRMDGLGSLSAEPAWRKVPSTYVVCSEDRALPPGLQREMAANAGTVVEWPTDHSPFLTRPAAIADLVCARMPRA